MLKKKRKVGRPSNASIRREKRIKLISIILVALIFISLIYFSNDYLKNNPSKINGRVYGINGDYCNERNIRSGNLVIGDSRTCQLYNYDNSFASFNSTWGGHYIYNSLYKESNMIATDAKRKNMKRYAQETIRETGGCNIFIFATVNDYKGVGSYETALDSFITLVNTAYNWSTKYKGKTVHPKVYVVSLVGKRNPSSLGPDAQKNVASFNKKLKKLAKQSDKYAYINITDLVDSSSYIDDYHYNNTTLKKIKEKLNSVASKNVGKDGVTSFTVGDEYESDYSANIYSVGSTTYSATTHGNIAGSNERSLVDNILDGSNYWHVKGCNGVVAIKFKSSTYITKVSVHNNNRNVFNISAWSGKSSNIKVKPGNGKMLGARYNITGGNWMDIPITPGYYNQIYIYMDSVNRDTWVALDEIRFFYNNDEYYHNNFSTYRYFDITTPQTDAIWGAASSNKTTTTTSKPGKVYIRLDANGGKLNLKKDKGYSLVGSTIYHNGNANIHTINYGGSLGKYGLTNPDSNTELNLTKKGYRILNGREWYCASGCSQNGKMFSDEIAYSASNFCNASKGDCYVTLKVNWVK